MLGLVGNRSGCWMHLVLPHMGGARGKCVDQTRLNLYRDVNIERGVVRGGGAAAAY